MNISPRLRFKSFVNPWAYDTLGNIATFKSGNTPSKENPNFWGGSIPWISASSMYGHLFGDSDNRVTEEALKAAKIAGKGTILLLVRGSMLFNKIPVGITTKDVTFNQDVKAINATKSVSNQFLFLWFLAKENRLLNMVTGTGIGAGKLGTDELQSLPCNFPSNKEEQQKIADFLTAVDTKINQLTEKHRLLKEYKKGVMQQIFSQQLRFKDKDGKAFPEWEEKHFGEVFGRVTQKNSVNNLNVLTISAQKGLISQLEYFNKSVSAKDVSGYYLLRKGDFAYNKSYSQGYPMGAIKPLKFYDSGVVSTLYICFRPKKGFKEAYFEQFFDAGMLNREIAKIAQEGARNHGLLNVSVKEFFDDIKLLVPHQNEQQKIAQFLQALDSKIAAVSEQIEQTKQFKKGLLQQMFV
ncbi:TPA: restriction endonuclease subunit S [Vibrio vulnificus]|nr:restriction endonuclease subunit S [Vibrio vulnificus]HDY8015386.1 restriction endonuclease subunit S [Vibrio vulnificus]HDY8204995.1 restriction endonuclease subunit S [Vibrio vulnificus]